MTIPVPLADLADTLTAHFDHAYLISLGGASDFVKVLTVDPIIQGERLIITIESDSARANVAADGRVTLIWPPREFHGHSLIVDGHGVLSAAGIEVEIDHAILHRPGTHADGPNWQFSVS